MATITTATFLITVTARDADTGTPITNPRIFLNGRAVSNPVLVPASTSVSMAVSASGYEASTFVQTFSSNQEVVFPLSLQVARPTLTLQFVPPTVVAWTLAGAAGSASGESEENGTAQTSIAPGTYTLTGTAIGYQNVSQTLTVTNTQSRTIQLLPATPTPSAPVASSATTAVPYDEDLDTQSLADDVAETIYDQSAYQGYFTAAQVRLYIGDLFIDELVSLQYARQDNRMPVYGYCSRYFDALAEGRTIVQGQVVLNYVHLGYLRAAIRNQQRNRQGADPHQANARKIAKALKASSDPALDSGTRAQASHRLNQLLSASTAADAALAKKLLQPASGDPYDSSPMAGLTPFEMRVEIGDGPYKTTRLFESVMLTGNEQIHDIRSGDLTGESYTFLARRLL